MCMIVLSLCMVYSNLDTVLTTVKLRKHVLSMYKLIIVNFLKFWSQSGVLQVLVLVEGY